MKNNKKLLNKITNQFNLKGLVKKTLKVISTFNGIGAATDALKQLGINYEMDTVCEIDKAANETYYKNNIKTNHVNDINVLLEKITQGLELDMLLQTPPCQAFSLAGYRNGFKDDRGNLFLTAIQLQQKVDANIVAYENVKGLISSDKKTGEYKSLINKEYQNTIGHTLHTIETLLLEDNRYNYYWKVINSADQGLPQNRERIFIIGIKKELDNGFTFPQERDIEFTVEDCLEQNVPENYFYKNIAGHIAVNTNQVKRPNRIHTLAKYEYTMTYESTRRIYAPYVSPCITCNNSAKYLINDKVRHLTPTESKRIHGFSEDFIFVGTQTQINKQLGNTVSPGVYVNLFTSIFNSANLNEKPTNNVSYKPQVKRGRPLKKTVMTNNHINIVKKITNNPDLDYLNLTEDRFNEYQSHLSNGGTMTMTVEFYNSNKDKKNGKLKDKYIISITSLEKLGFRDKKNGIRRVKITGTKTKLDKIPKSHVLFTRPGGKGKFESKFEQVHTHLGIDKTKVDTVIDGFFGGGGYTLKNIDKLDFNNYIINDLDPLITKTMMGIKKDPAKVIELYKILNNEFQELIPNELKDYKKSTGRKDKVLKKLREKNIYLKKYYQDLLSKLDSHNELDTYTVASIYIFTSQKTTSGFFKYNKDNTIKKTSFNWHFNLNDKTKMIKHWSYLLNKHNVEVRNQDIFDLLQDSSINRTNSLIYLDPPYVGVKYIYNSDNSEDFQLKLLRETQQFKYRIYSNEDCSELYELGINKYFTHILKFDRNNKMGQPTKENGGFEFLGCNRYQDTIIVNNTNYQPQFKLAA
jgi:DNA (cytosine-5)-methyltransferase 1